MRFKECTQCKDNHPLDYFHKKNENKSTGLASQCSICRNKNYSKKRFQCVKKENKYLRQENDFLSSQIEEISRKNQIQANIDYERQQNGL